MNDTGILLPDELAKINSSLKNKYNRKKYVQLLTHFNNTHLTTIPVSASNSQESPSKKGNSALKQHFVKFYNAELEVANKLFSHKKYQEAREKYMEIINYQYLKYYSPKDMYPDICNNIAMCYYREENYLEALKYFRIAKHHYPPAPENYAYDPTTPIANAPAIIQIKASIEVVEAKLSELKIAIPPVTEEEPQLDVDENAETVSDDRDSSLNSTTSNSSSTSSTTTTDNSTIETPRELNMDLDKSNDDPFNNNNISLLGTFPYSSTTSKSSSLFFPSTNKNDNKKKRKLVESITNNLEILDIDDLKTVSKLVVELNKKQSQHLRKKQKFTYSMEDYSKKITLQPSSTVQYLPEVKGDTSSQTTTVNNPHK